MGELDNTVAVITGAARGQGRSHAVALAEQGADIIAVDICADIEAIPYSLGTKSDLDKTAGLVEAAGRRVVPVVADVRDLAQLEAAVQTGIDQLGDIDIVIANAGVVAIGDPDPHTEPVFTAIVDTNLKGVWHTLLATVPRSFARVGRVGRSGQLVAGLDRRGGDGSAAMFAYAASKHGCGGADALGGERLRATQDPRQLGASERRSDPDDSQRLRGEPDAGESECGRLTDAAARRAIGRIPGRYGSGAVACQPAISVRDRRDRARGRRSLGHVGVTQRQLAAGDLAGFDAGRAGVDPLLVAAGTGHDVHGLDVGVPPTAGAAVGVRHRLAEAGLSRRYRTQRPC